MSLLLPQTRAATVRQVRNVDIHGDRYVDLVLEIDDAADEPFAGRVPAGECVGGLAAGDRVQVRFVMGVMTRVIRNG